MNIKNLITFKKIIETGSFQNAANKLHYTQSTVTFQIKQLEEELSFQLFEKIGRKMELTSAGKGILPYVDTILQNADYIYNYGKNISKIEGELKLAIPDSILIYTMQPFIQEFLKKAPNVQLIIDSIPSGEINNAIVNGSADIGINCEKNYYPSSVIHEYLGTYEALLIASPDINKNLTDFVTPNQKKNISFICNEPDGYYQLDMNDYLKQKNIILNQYMKVQSIEAVKQCVMHNLGIAVVPSYSVEKEIEEKKLIILKTDIAKKIYHSIFVYNKNKYISPQMKLAFDLLKSNKKSD